MNGRIALIISVKIFLNSSFILDRVNGANAIKWTWALDENNEKFMKLTKISNKEFAVAQIIVIPVAKKCIMDSFCIRMSYVDRNIVPH